ncbi:MAG TPA: RHS repeat-associated core domain-containing protein [Pirellulales bacterium]|nr:RHS repeat-associated core domain-containing protein [Pirellulales bacterium]
MAAPLTAQPCDVQHISGDSGRPVRYFNGEIQLATTDLSASGFGLDFGQTRIFSNRLGGDVDYGNGYNWLVRQLPQLVEQAAGTIMVLRGTRSALWFDLVGDAYVGRYGTKFTLAHDAMAGTFALAAPNGEITLFNDFDSGATAGLYKSQSTAGGQLIQVTSYAPSTALGIGEVQRSYTTGGVTTVESFLYNFTGFDLASVTLRRQVGGGAWQNIRRAVYAYYGVGAAHGLAGDLQSATVQTWDGSAWQTIDNHYYRYWTTTGGGALAHCLKYVVNSAAYERMVAAGLNPLTASDAQLAGYADLYLEYNADRRVTRETVDGGLYTYRFSYAANHNPTYVDGYNNWHTKTVETRPDGGINTVYTNYVGDVILKRLSQGANAWIEAVKFDSNANVLQYAYPSAVTGFDDTHNDLAIAYRAASGLIRTYSYYGSTAPGYTQSESVQQGSGGTPVLLKEYEYTQQSGGGATVYPTTAVTVYRDDAAAQPIMTSFGYTFYSGTTAVQQRTTTLPVVPASQNGSGIADTRVKQFDQWGNPASITDERGTVTAFTVDIVTGGATRRTDDATGMALVSDFTLDNLGRTIQQLGPSHTVDLGGTATVVRTATWTVYDDVNQAVRSARGYATGTSPSYSYTLVNPVSIAIMDGDGNVTDQARATRASTSGPLLPSDTFAQSSYVRWTHNVYNDNDQPTTARVYFSIPTSGDGAKGTNYNEQDFGYDSLGRQNKVVSGGGTITRTVHDPRGLALSVYVGTNDTGATDTDPTGGGAAGNNMVAVTINQYDSGASGGDGNLTQQSLPVDSNAANNRVTGFQYDWRNRQAQVNLPQDSYQVNTFDALDRVVQVDLRSQATNNPIGRTAANYDNRGRAYQSLRYGVDPATGAVSNVLTDNTWYDPASNVLLQLPAGSSAFTKSVYDAVGRRTAQYVGFYAGSISYSQAVDISGATIVKQSEMAWDEASNGIQTMERQRFHNATGLGSLTQPGGLQPQARVTYTAKYPDGTGRKQAIADYGTNGDIPLTRSPTVPVSSDAVHVRLSHYNDRGEPYQSIDAKGTANRATFDDAGRRTQLIRNYQEGQPSTGDVNVTVEWTHTADNEMATAKALNTVTGDQLTVLNYGTTLGTSDVARNDVLSSTVYADGGAVSYLVNRQSDRKQLADQNGTVHAFDFDLLGRQIFDRVTALGTDIDGTVQRISRTYEVRGLLQNVTSYSSPTVGSGAVVNDVQRVYDSFEQPVTEYQEHNEAVDPSTSVKVQYQYADGSANTIRPTAMVYPNGRLLHMDYGASGGIDDALSRIASLIDNDGTTHLVDYTYIGGGTFVQSASPEPQIAWSLINGSGIDPYTGLDQFNQIADNRWYSAATNADLDRIQHGYDRAGNRLYRKNAVAEAAGVYLDELYAYDGLYRLARLDRGQLNATNSGIVSGTENFTQAWGLDATGNWATFDEAATGGPWTLQQARTSNTVNEITNITGGGWIVPTYDNAGNTTQFPHPSTPSTADQATYDAWNRTMSVFSDGSLAQQNGYDGENRRLTKLTAETVRHYYFSSQWQSLEERLGSSTSADRQFVWGLRYIDDLVLRDRGGERLYAMQDPNWNITAACDATGTVKERYGYAPYGAPTFFSAAFVLLSSSAFDWERLFGGYRSDPETGLYIARERYLQFALGRWLATDPAGDEGDNLYLYVSNNPLISTDPSGLRQQDPDKPCNMCLCCSPLPFDPNTGKGLCPNGPKKQQACHCFVRTTNNMTNNDKACYKGTRIDYHGGFDPEANQTACCNCLPFLQSFPVDSPLAKKLSSLPTGTTCIKVGQGAPCGQLNDCLNAAATRLHAERLCYGFCTPPNSNTFAFEYINNCLELIANAPPGPPAAPAGIAQGCRAGAPGYGGLTGNEMSATNCPPPPDNR